MSNAEFDALVKRVRAILAASEERDYDYISVNVDESDLRALCDEVERLTRERDAAIAGALFDFAGHLTTMDEVYEVGASRDSTRMVAELQAWAKKRNLYLIHLIPRGQHKPQDALTALEAK